MIHYVSINKVYLYYGRSHDKALSALQTAINIMTVVNGTGVITYRNLDSMGSMDFVNGEEKL